MKTVAFFGDVYYIVCFGMQFLWVRTFLYFLFFCLFLFNYKFKGFEWRKRCFSMLLQGGSLPFVEASKHPVAKAGSSPEY